MILSTKAILFDMDGVLIDSAPAVERVWRVWARNHGLDPALVVAQAHGRRSIETIRAVAPTMDAEKENIVVEQMEIDDKEGVTALPGAARLLAQMPDESLCHRDLGHASTGGRAAGLCRRSRSPVHDHRR